MGKSIFKVLLMVFCLNTISGGRCTGISELNGLVTRLSDLRLAISQESMQWKNEKKLMNERQKLLEKEAKDLESNIAKKQGDVSLAQKERAELVKKKQLFTKTLKELGKILEKAELKLLKWKRVLPEPLFENVRDSFSRLEKSKNRNTNKRLQLILSLYSQIERINQEVHVFEQVLIDQEGQEKVCDVIYVGLASGFAVSRDNASTATSSPGKEGWVWQWKKSLAKEVRRAVQILNDDELAANVVLPYCLGKEVL